MSLQTLLPIQFYILFSFFTQVCDIIFHVFKCFLVVFNFFFFFSDGHFFIICIGYFEVILCFTSKFYLLQYYLPLFAKFVTIFLNALLSLSIISTISSGSNCFSSISIHLLISQKILIVLIDSFVFLLFCCPQLDLFHTQACDSGPCGLLLLICSCISFHTIYI